MDEDAMTDQNPDQYVEKTTTDFLLKMLRETDEKIEEIKNTLELKQSEGHTQSNIRIDFVDNEMKAFRNDFKTMKNHQSIAEQDIITIKDELKSKMNDDRK